MCLTWFPIGGYRRTQYITSIGLFYKKVGILLEAIIGVCYFTIFSVCLVSVSKADSIFFTPSFDYADLVIAMVCEASKGLD